MLFDFQFVKESWKKIEFSGKFSGKIIFSTKLLSSTTGFTIDNNDFWAPNQHIRMISEVSCGTDNCHMIRNQVMAAENSTLASQE